MYQTCNGLAMLYIPSLNGSDTVKVAFLLSFESIVNALNPNRVLSHDDVDSVNDACVNVLMATSLYKVYTYDVSSTTCQDP